MYLNQLTMLWIMFDFIVLINIMRENIMFCDGEKELEHTKANAELWEFPYYEMTRQIA